MPKCALGPTAAGSMVVLQTQRDPIITGLRNVCSLRSRLGCDKACLVVG